jgi:hypothetical protein
MSVAYDLMIVAIGSVLVFVAGRAKNSANYAKIFNRSVATTVQNEHRRDRYRRSLVSRRTNLKSIDDASESFKNALLNALLVMGAIVILLGIAGIINHLAK